MNQPVVITAFYHFFAFPNYMEAKNSLLDFCKSNNLKGTILLASEGINSTIAGDRAGIDALYSYLRDQIGIQDLSMKESAAEILPFDRMKVRLKKEIVTIGLEVKPLEKCGTYIEPKAWDEFISRSDVITIDTRNNYEVAIGTFAGSVNPHTRTFREFPAWAQEHLQEHKNKKVAMFCTGGIRCEKSTAYLKELGFDEVYHLKGGILQYLQDTGNANNKWQGKCFVFDERIAVDDHLVPSPIELCSNCQQQISASDVKALQGTKSDQCATCSRAAYPSDL